MKSFKSNSAIVKKCPFEAKGVLGENSLKYSHFSTEQWRANSGAQLNSFSDKNTNAWESESMHLQRFGSVC